MKRNVGFLALVILAGFLAWSWAGSLEPPAPPSPTMTTLEELSTTVSALANGGAFSFIGTTTQTFDGGAGWEAMTKACAAEFPGSRMAFSDEYRNTVDPPTISSSAWIQFRPAFLSGGNAAQVFDAAGLHFQAATSPFNWNCTQWQVPAGTGGLTLNVGGGMGLNTCAAVQPVACSAP